MKHIEYITKKARIEFHIEEWQNVLEFLSIAKYEIVNIEAVRDGRSRAYTGYFVIIAEQKV